MWLIYEARMDGKVSSTLLRYAYLIEILSLHLVAI